MFEASRDARHEQTTDLDAMCLQMRRWIVQQSYASEIGHIGSALGIVEIVATLWGSILHRPGTDDLHRDRFILGKGHAALTLYSAMRWCGRLDEQTFATYCADGTQVSGHPEHWLPGIDASTGSLGQGLSIGCGMALGLRQAGSSARVYVLVSDAECNEGQTWEAAMFAAQHQLGNLCVIVDLNEMQALGKTNAIVDLSPMHEKWTAFRWNAQYVDGHDCGSIAMALKGCQRSPGPSVLLARTKLGKGVSFMEDRLEWHYRNISSEQLSLAEAELRRTTVATSAD